MLGQAVQVSVIARAGQDGRVPGRVQPAELPGQGTLDDRSPAASLAVCHQLVQLLYRALRQPHRDLNTHDLIIPGWYSLCIPLRDASSLTTKPSAFRVGGKEFR